MMRKCIAACGTILMMGALLAMASPPAAARPQQQAANPPYSLAEYNAFQSASGQTNPQAKIQACDDFVTKFPKSVLIPLIDEMYYVAYNQLKNYPKTIEAVDTFVAIPEEKFTPVGLSKEAVTGKKLEALNVRAAAFLESFNLKDTNAQDELTKARDAALQGLQFLNELQKPASISDEKFAEAKKPYAIRFNYTAGSTAFQLKDYKNAIQYFSAELADNPSEAATYWQLGVAYLQLAAQQAPPAPAQQGAAPGAASVAAATTDPATQQYHDLMMNGFWAIARSIGLKGPQEDQMKTYLRAQMFNYEQPACGPLLDDQMNELIQLATNSPTRPDTYSIPSAADLGKILQSSNLLSILGDLQTGGDKAKMTWLAVCGQEIPDVVGKIIDVTPAPDNSTVDIKVFTAATGEAIMAGTTANLDVTVTGQPEAATLEKNNQIKFTGTLEKFDAQPLMVYFDKGKVDPSSFPTEKKEKVPGKKPGGTGRGRG
jgi:hypothetical protein